MKITKTITYNEYKNEIKNIIDGVEESCNELLNKLKYGTSISNNMNLKSNMRLLYSLEDEDYQLLVKFDKIVELDIDDGYYMLECHTFVGQSSYEERLVYKNLLLLTNKQYASLKIKQNNNGTIPYNKF